MNDIKTVGELIKKLQEFDPDLAFQISAEGGHVRASYIYSDFIYVKTEGERTFLYIDTD